MARSKRKKRPNRKRNDEPQRSPSKAATSTSANVSHKSPEASIEASPAEPKQKGASSSAETKQKELKDVPVIQGRNWVVTVGALLTAATTLVGGTYAFVKYVEIAPLERSAKDKNRQLEQATTKSQGLTNEVSDLRMRLSSKETEATLPTLVRPSDGATVFGRNVVLSWQQGIEPASDDREYFLELFDTKTQATKTINLPAGVRVNLPLERASGIYFWRVRRGYFDEHSNPVPQGPWSRWSQFEVFPTVLSRIKEKGVLRVATKPVAEDDRFVFRNVDGQYAGFEIDLVRWIAQQLATSVGTPVEVEFLQRRWAHKKNHLQTVNDGDVELAIRSITKTRARERIYGSMRFTSGYITNSQVFVQLEQLGDFPDALQERLVGVKGGGTNEKAAEFLQADFGYRLDASFENYPDLRKALRDRTIDYALVDSLLINRFIQKGDVKQFGPPMDEQLVEFNNDNIGGPTEEYAIAVHVPGKDDELLTLINCSSRDFI